MIGCTVTSVSTNRSIFNCSECRSLQNFVNSSVECVVHLGSTSLCPKLLDFCSFWTCLCLVYFPGKTCPTPVPSCSHSQAADPQAPVHQISRSRPHSSARADEDESFPQEKEKERLESYQCVRLSFLHQRAGPTLSSNCNQSLATHSRFVSRLASRNRDVVH